MEVEFISQTNIGLAFVKRRLTLVPATGRGRKNTPSAVLTKNHQVSNGIRSYFLSHCYRPFWLSEATEYHYIYFRFYVAGLDLTSTRLVLRLAAMNAYRKQWYKLQRCDVSGILAFDSGNMSMQEYEQGHFYIFKMTDKTGSSNRSSSKAHSRSSQSNTEWIWSKYYCNSTAKETVFDHTKLKESVHQWMLHWRTTGSSSVAIKTGSTYICDSMS